MEDDGYVTCALHWSCAAGEEVLMLRLKLETDFHNWCHYVTTGKLLYKVKQGFKLGETYTSKLKVLYPLGHSLWIN